MLGVSPSETAPRGAPRTSAATLRQRKSPRGGPGNGRFGSQRLTSEMEARGTADGGFASQRLTPEMEARGTVDGAAHGRSVTVLISGDVRLYREGLERIIGADPRFTVVGSSARAQDAIDVARARRPELVLVDLATAGSMNAIRALAAESISSVAIGVPETDREVVECAEAGVAGYVSRDDSIADLIATMETVIEGDMHCSPRIAAILRRRVAALAARPPTASDKVRLTVRESEIVALIDEGLSNKEIGQRLSIQLATVKNHVHNVLEKLQVNRRGEAAAFVRTAREDPVRP
jgi:two-component system, NarL family, nitrate/nitrite response regulator NarL